MRYYTIVRSLHTRESTTEKLKYPCIERDSNPRPNIRAEKMHAPDGAANEVGVIQLRAEISTRDLPSIMQDWQPISRDFLCESLYIK